MEVLTRLVSLVRDLLVALAKASVSSNAKAATRAAEASNREMEATDSSSGRQDRTRLDVSSESNSSKAHPSIGTLEAAGEDAIRNGCGLKSTESRKQKSDRVRSQGTLISLMAVVVMSTWPVEKSTEYRRECLLTVESAR